MTKFVVNAKVDQIVTKDIVLQLEARTEEEAEEKCRSALQTYPEPLEGQRIDRIITTKTQHWIPRDIEFTSIRQEKPSE